MRIKLFIVLFVSFFMTAGTLMAKDLHKVIFKVEQIHCQNCVNKIENNIKFEKGLKKITTDLETKTVIIVYDADKTNIEKLKEGFKKINYDVLVVEEEKIDK